MANRDEYDSILRRGFDEFRDFVNPLIAHRAQMAAEPIRFVRVDNGLLHDEAGRAFEDLHGTQALGHRHPAIVAAIRDYLDSDAPNWYPSRVNPFAGRLARRLCERSGYDNVYFGCSGSDVVEAAMKLARALTRRPRILSLEGAYHGCAFGSCALMTPGPFRDPFAPHLPGAESLPHNDVDALHAAFKAGEVAAVVVEPIQVEGGVRPLSEAYIAALCELTTQHGALLVADEVQTGFGRTGRFLYSETWPRRPDVALLAKTLGGGLVPISAMLTRRAIFERAYGSSFQSGESHNMTFSFNALTAVAALAAIELITDDLMARVARVGAAFRDGLRTSLAGSPLLAEVRGDGFIIGVDLHTLDHPWLSFEHFGYPDLAGRSTVAPLVCHRLYRHGWFAFSCGHRWNVLRLQPRFEIPEDKLATLPPLIREQLDFLSALAD